MGDPKNSHVTLSHSEYIDLLSAKAARRQCQKIYAETLAGRGLFKIDSTQIDPTVDRVVNSTKRRYPSLEIPFHSRWGHFRAGGIDRVRELQTKWVSSPGNEVSQRFFELVIVSVLLDAGAGTSWSYQPSQGSAIGRSEGLALASLEAYLAGTFSHSATQPNRVDHEGLNALTVAILEKRFQVNAQNPLIGLEGRVSLLKKLAKVLETTQTLRLGDFFDIWAVKAAANSGVNAAANAKPNSSKSISASKLLHEVLIHLGPIWPSRLVCDHGPLGDAWRSELLNGETVVFHKLSQWLTYSLLEPYLWAGFEICDLDELTGLPEYRNGGLFLDTKVLLPKDENAFSLEYEAGSEFVIQWRALTVCLLDEVGMRVKERLQRPQLSLANILEGGTWWAGREIAKELRADGSPPLKLKLDGTVF